MVSARTKLTVLLLVIFLGASAAYAAPGDLALNSRTFAHEIGNQMLTLADQGYLMGINRTPAQDMVVRYQLTGATFATLPGMPVIGGAGTANVTYPGVGGVGQNFVEYEIDILTDFVGGTTTITLPAPQIYLTATGLGASASVTISLRDLFFQTGVDLNGIKTRQVATLQPVTSITATTDTATVIDALTAPATTGFVGTNLGTIGVPPLNADDFSIEARASVTLNTTVPGVFAADGLADYVLGADGLITITVTGDFTGLMANGFCYDIDDNGICVGPEVFTVVGNTATLTLPGNFPFMNIPHSIVFVRDGVTQLATRTFAITAKLDMTPFSPTAGGQDRNPISGANANWWTWSINGTTMRAVYVTFSPGNDTKFRFINNSSVPVTVKGTLVLDQGTVTMNPAFQDANGNITLSIPANGSVQATLLINPAAGTGELGPLVSSLDTGVQPVRARANFLALTATNNVAGQVLIASPVGVITVVPLIQNPLPGLP